MNIHLKYGLRTVYTGVPAAVSIAVVYLTNLNGPLLLLLAIFAIATTYLAVVYFLCAITGKPDLIYEVTLISVLLTPF